MLKKFEDKHKFKLFGIVIMSIILNFFVFGNLFLMRAVVSDDYYLSSGQGFYRIFVFLLAILLFVLASFEIRLIDINKKRVLQKLQIDYFAKWVFIVIWIMLEYITNGDVLVALMVLGFSFMAHVIYNVIIFFHYKNKINAVIVDWTDRHRDKSDNSNISNMTISKAWFKFAVIANITLTIFAVVFCNSKLWMMYNISILGIILFVVTMCAFVICWVSFMYRCRSLDAIKILSLTFSTGLLFAGYFLIDNDIIDWAIIPIVLIVFLAPIFLANGIITHNILFDNKCLQQDKEI